MRTHPSMRGKVRKAERRHKLYAEIKRIFLQSTADLLYEPLPIVRHMERWLP